MPVNDSPSDFANYLLDFLGDRWTALAHAEWAYGFVIKSETKAFWKEVIEELKKLKDTPNAETKTH